MSLSTCYLEVVHSLADHILFAQPLSHGLPVMTPGVLRREAARADRRAASHLPRLQSPAPVHAGVGGLARQQQQVCLRG